MCLRMLKHIIDRGYEMGNRDISSPRSGLEQHQANSYKMHSKLCRVQDEDAQVSSHFYNLTTELALASGYYKSTGTTQVLFQTSEEL